MRGESQEGALLAAVTVSRRYQVVIPRDVRESVGIRPGQRVEIFPYAGHIVIVPVPDVRAMRGFMRGIDTDVPREPDRV